MKAINSRVIPVAGYVMNVCHLGKNELDELDKLVKNVLRREGFHGRQSSDERLYTKRTEGGRGLKSFKEVYDETRTRVACYMATSTNEWIAAAWRNEIRKEQTSLKREVERIMRDVNTIVSFDEGSIAIGEEKCTDWKDGWTMRGTVLERNGQKLFWDWEHRMRTNCTERRPELTLEDSANKTIVLVDMACPMESNRMKKRDDKVMKYQQLCFEVRERREGYTVEVIPTIIGCLGGGMKELRTNIKRILKNYCDDNELHIIANEMQKTVLWESESIIRKTLSGLLTWSVFYLANKIW